MTPHQKQKRAWCACCGHHVSVHRYDPTPVSFANGALVSRGPGQCSIGGCTCAVFELHVDTALVGRVRRRPGEPTVKQCACGRAYTQRQWNELGTPKVQVFDGPDENGEPIAPLELRDCACGSTLALEVRQ